MNKPTKAQKTAIVMLGIAFLMVSTGCTEKIEEPGMEMQMNVNDEIIREAVMKSDYQEIDLQISATGYSPDVIIAKKGIPLKINVHSTEDAGCATEILFPDFNIDTKVPAGSSDLIEIMPAEEGTFQFRCSMDMYRGKLIIK